MVSVVSVPARNRPRKLRTIFRFQRQAVKPGSPTGYPLVWLRQDKSLFRRVNSVVLACILVLVNMKSIVLIALSMLLGIVSPAAAQTPSVEKEKFVLLNNGATLGMVIKSVVKADKQRLKLTDQQLPKAQEIITQAVVAFNDGVKKLKASGMNQKKLRTLAVQVETDKVRAYKPILTPDQYKTLVTQHQKIYPESKV